MVTQDVHKIVALQMKCNFTVEELQLIGRALEVYNNEQMRGNWNVRELNATEALLTRIV